jgi:hypothetical protein
MEGIHVAKKGERRVVMKISRLIAHRDADQPHPSIVPGRPKNATTFLKNMLKSGFLAKIANKN